MESTSIVSGSTDPVFNEKHEFHVPTVKGVLHLAVYHIAKKDSQFIGKFSFKLKYYLQKKSYFNRMDHYLLTLSIESPYILHRVCLHSPLIIFLSTSFLIL